jgi:DNA-binding response OmpR family regulator
MYYEITPGRNTVQPVDAVAVGRILVVDDDRQFATFLLAALESQGHDVDWTGCLSDALASLYSNRYDLVIADLRLPDGSGLQLLRDATDDGLLFDTAAILLTGQDFEEPDDIRVFHKTGDHDAFLRNVAGIIGQAKRRRLTRRAAPAGAVPKGHSGDKPRRDSRKRIELVLYTSAASDKCQKAIRALHQVLAAYDTSQISLSICDLAENPAQADEDMVVFTPTLVKRGPGPRTWVIGNLDQTEVLIDLLDVNGVDRRGDG